jgi:hypothetical protein
MVWRTNRVGSFSRRALLRGAGTMLGGSVLLSSHADAAAVVANVAPHFKCTEFIRRRPGLELAAMIRHWREVRAPLLRDLPGLARFTFNIVDPQRSPNTYDGAIEMWFGSAGAYDANLVGARAEMLHRLGEDAKQWMHPEFLAMFTRETVIRALPRAVQPKAKRLGLVGRPSGMTPEEYLRRWRDEHAPQVDRQPGLQRYTLNFIEGPRSPSSPWDGYAELSWTDWAAFEEASRQIKMRNEVANRSAFFHTHLLLLVEEL